MLGLYLLDKKLGFLKMEMFWKFMGIVILVVFERFFMLGNYYSGFLVVFIYGIY